MLVAWLSLQLASAVFTSRFLSFSRCFFSSRFLSFEVEYPGFAFFSASSAFSLWVMGGRKEGRKGGVSVGVLLLYMRRACICATAAVCVCGSPPRGVSLLDLVSQPRQAIVKHKL